MSTNTAKGVGSTIDKLLLSVSMFKDRDKLTDEEFCDKYGHQEPVWTKFNSETCDTYGHCDYCQREIVHYSGKNDDTRPVRLEPKARPSYVPEPAYAK